MGDRLVGFLYLLSNMAIKNFSANVHTKTFLQNYSYHKNYFLIQDSLKVYNLSF